MKTGFIFILTGDIIAIRKSVCAIVAIVTTIA